MAVHASHASLPYPVKGARFSLLIPYLDADGDPTAPTTPDTEISKDGAAAVDCAEEVSVVTDMDGMALMTLSGAETDCSCLALNAKAGSGPKATLLTLYPRVLPTILSGTASAGAAGSITLAAGPATDGMLVGCIVKTTGGTGGGGTGGANNQARVITDWNGQTKVAAVTPDWETPPNNTTTYVVLLTDMASGNPTASEAVDLVTDVADAIGARALTEATATAPDPAAMDWDALLGLIMTVLVNQVKHNRNTGEIEIYNKAGTKILEAPASDTGGATGTLTRGAIGAVD